MTREHNERMTAAYYTAVIPLMKNIPKLEKLLIASDKPKRPVQTWEDQFAAALAWAGG